MRTLATVTAILSGVCVLSACGGSSGGGGGTPMPSPIALATDPNAIIQTPSSKTYDLRQGTPAAPYVLAQNDNVQVSFNGTTEVIERKNTRGFVYPLDFYGNNKIISESLNQTTSSLQGEWITPNVKAAWAQGWTGAGVKIGVLDDFTANDEIELAFKTLPGGDCTQRTGYVTCSNEGLAAFKMTHGDVVSMIAGGGLSSLKGIKLETGNFLTSIGDSGTYSLAGDYVFKMSSPKFGVAKDAQVLRNDFLTYQTNTNGLFAVFKAWGEGSDATSKLYRDLKVVNLSLGGSSDNRKENNQSYQTQRGYADASVTPDAVYVKAVGNQSCVISNTNCDPYNAVLYYSPPFKEKSVLVGALDQAGGSMAIYSNKAGNYASRFVVADGRGVGTLNSPFIQGTSFAAPRVSGYVAILRQKFPNLNAPQSASIILDTASWNPNWGAKDAANQAIYGQGEANLGRALAPVGTLR